jgi:CRP-like cAMP-binding protein
MQRLPLRQPASTRVNVELTVRAILLATDFSDGAKVDRLLLSLPTLESWVLKALPRADVEHLSGQAQQVALPLRQTLLETGTAIEHVYFIEHGLALVRFSAC